jgi:hypothetical protein
VTQCSTHISLSPLGKKPVVVTNDGGQLTSDAGVLLLREVDRKLGLSRALAASLREWRQPGKVRHSLPSLLAQRLYQIAQGYADCNDANALRLDPALKLALDQDPEGPHLAGQATLSRLENHSTPQDCYRLSEALLNCYLAWHRTQPPTRIVLDIDATDDQTYGQQQLSFFHAHYRGHCYLPLLVFAQHEGRGEQYLLAAVLRAGNVHAGARAMALLRRIILRLRQAFPGCQIEVRADSGFALPEVYAGCEALGVPYTLSLGQNSRLLTLAAPWLQDAEAIYEETAEKARVYGDFRYAARGWPQERRVVTKAEVMSAGPNPRFVVTSRTDLSPRELYHFYCQRGDSENRIKELKEDLEADRLSCHGFWANQFRLLLHAAAYVLLQYLRASLAGTALASAQVRTLRLTLLKVGGKLTQSVRRLRLSVPAAYPWCRLWSTLASALCR